MPGLSVGVLRGGRGNEYDLSLAMGGSVLSTLNAKFEYRTRDILIDRSGGWHLDGLPILPNRLAGQVDVVLNSLLGHHEEDSFIPTTLKKFNINHTGSGHLGLALSANKIRAKEILAEVGVRVPFGVVVDSDEKPREAAKRVFSKIGAPWVVKPINREASIGVALVRYYSDLPAAIEWSLNHSPSGVLVEEFIRGREVAIGVVENFRNQEIYFLPPQLIHKPSQFQVLEHDVKQEKSLRTIFDHPWAEGEKEELDILAALAHETLNLRHYSMTDVIIAPRGIYFIETNALPPIDKDTLFARALERVGHTWHDFLGHLIHLARK